MCHPVVEPADEQQRSLEIAENILCNQECGPNRKDKLKMSALVAKEWIGRLEGPRQSIIPEDVTT